ncbi:molybdopterin binding motif, CinA N-terminal domain [Geofilum rubicundum JCM 15548]|uniref:CinA-like protein n=1 Tax=Geofilum rubicundum JCM 15548 TaxID=1236989 RepID=A0A0E9LU28_9BACT|nr:molybdopterin binding motif, CinA N-terminal domain [Geofilum rubicundum JCM 15548]
MQVDIITIGDELLIGQVVDTNSAWMGRELNKIGLSVHRITSISDQEEEILHSLEEAINRSSVVLITGGLGPTRDDITKAALCRFFNTKLVFNEAVYADVERMLKGRVKHINQLNRDQAMVPEKCTIIRNPVGTAPIMWFQHAKGIVVSMPGVPIEMKQAMSDQILPRLLEKYQSGIVRHKTIHVFNIPEAVLAEMLSDWEDAVPDYIKVAYLPSPGKLRLRLSGRGEDADKIDGAIEKAIQALYPIIGEHIFGLDDQTAQQELLRLLTEKHQTLAFAESCSGGFMAHLVTAIPGASAAFKGSIVAYANEVKTGQLGVDPMAIEQYGAVSRQVVEQMALGACKALALIMPSPHQGLQVPQVGVKKSRWALFGWHGRGMEKW